MRINLLYIYKVFITITNLYYCKIKDITNKEFNLYSIIKYILHFTYEFLVF